MSGVLVPVISLPCRCPCGGLEERRERQPVAEPGSILTQPVVRLLIMNRLMTIVDGS